ncbi:SDR family NAD(P)-dependent oxidoreductase [Streptomyces albiflaviniger]|nr:SDR family NAD(P)-dependent oxidoreductase [Streptomyces albiflaviniger]
MTVRRWQGVLFVLYTGIQWEFLPQELGFGSGPACWRRLDGHDLVLVARRAARFRALAAELTGQHDVRVETVVADLGDAGDLGRVARRTAEDDVELLVNNAGINGYGLFAETDTALLEKVMAVNVVALTRLARAAVPGMLARGRGAVVNVASTLAFAGSLPPDPLPVRAVYGGTKGYVVTFSRTLAAELDGAPVRVQVLCPGPTATEFHLTQGQDPVAGDVARVHDDGGIGSARLPDRLATARCHGGDGPALGVYSSATVVLAGC